MLSFALILVLWTSKQVNPEVNKNTPRFGTCMFSGDKIRLLRENSGSFGDCLLTTKLPQIMIYFRHFYRFAFAVENEWKQRYLK